MKSKGLGDDVERIIKLVFPKFAQGCSGCKKRKEKLNKMFPKK